MEGLVLTLVIWVTWCPQYDNLPYCVDAIRNITVYTSDYWSKPADF